MTLHKMPTRERARNPKGFTLLEVGVALGLMAMLLGVASMGFNAITSAELRKTMGMMQGLARDTYARAALSGNSARIVYDLDKGVFYVQQAEGGVVVSRDLMGTDADGKAAFDAADERLEGTEDSDDVEDLEKRRLFAGPSWSPVDDDMGKPISLPDGVRFHSVWVDHLDEAVTGGQVATIFFPGGYAQEAFVTLTDDDEGDFTLTLVINPLTGETYVETEIPRIPTR